MGVIVTSTIFTLLLGSVMFVAKNVQPHYERSEKVKLRDGSSIIGRIAMNKGYIAYSGIPYAEPPVGNLRFAPPQPAKPLKRPFYAIREAPQCIQKNYLFYSEPKAEGSEDCLYLNVYTPRSPKYNIKLPVMVWIHYGGWFVGTGNTNLSGPEYFMEKNVILVTFNYRLGIFGFFSTGDDSASGNWGLKDQVLALQWIKDNIQAFGGDPDRITIFGQSAGAGSVHLHLLSPQTEGLFSRAMSFSGSALALWANSVLPPAFIAAKQAEYSNCPNPLKESSKSLVHCLRNIDAATLLDQVDKFKYFSIEPLTVYIPVTETLTDYNTNPYLTATPLEILKSGNFKKDIPFILGVTADEGLIRGAPIIRQSETREKLNQMMDQLGPAILGVQLSVAPEEIPATWNKIKDMYVSDGIINIENDKSLQDFVDLYSDRSFVYPSYQSALLHAKYGHKDLWFYNFDYRGKYSYGDIFATTNETVDYDFGVSHCDDLIYIFKSPELFPKNVLDNPADSQMSSILLSMWTKFARDGEPWNMWHRMPDLSNRTVLHNSDMRFLNITGSHESSRSINLQMNGEGSGFLPERMKFWQSLPLNENVPEIV